MKKNHIKVFAFMRSLIDVAIEINGGSLSNAKRTKIIDIYNNKQGSIRERAIFTIEKVTGKKIPHKSNSRAKLKILLSKFESSCNAMAKKANQRK